MTETRLYCTECGTTRTIPTISDVPDDWSDVSPYGVTVENSQVNEHTGVCSGPHGDDNTVKGHVYGNLTLDGDEVVGELQGMGSQI